MGSFIRRVVFVVLAVSILFPGGQIPPVHGQTCTNITAPVFCRSYPIIGGGPYTRWQCFVNLTRDENCAFPTVSSGGLVTRCYYIPGQDRLVAAQALGAKGAGFCEVNCDCGVLRIDQDDGLPVELMDFSIE